MSLLLLVMPALTACQVTQPTTTIDRLNEESIATVHFLDVGQGDSILIQTSDKTVLIDGGERDQSEKVVQYLERLGIQSIDLLISTHPHSDHIGGLIGVLKQIPVQRVIDSGRVHTSQTYLNYLTLIDQKDIDFTVATDESIDLGDECSLEIYAPLAEYEEINDSSIVAKLVAGSISVLFTGDMQNTAEQDMLAQHNLKATVLKVAHHGSSSSSSSDFLAEVNPEVAVISVGEENSYGHPHAETLAALSDLTTYRTDLDGTIVMTTDGSNCAWATEK